MISIYFVKLFESNYKDQELYCIHGYMTAVYTFGFTFFFRDMSIRSNIDRIFTIWEERKIYDKDFIEELLAILSEISWNFLFVVYSGAA